MAFLGTAISLIGGAAKFLFGGSSGGSSPVETITKAVDEYKYTDEEKAGAEERDVEQARKFATPGEPLGFIGQVVNGANHIIRPWITFELMSGLFGYRQLPDISGIDPLWMKLIIIVITFWFGGRMVVKDLPALIDAVRKLRK